MAEILVTGSVGRSSTAEMIAALVRASGLPALLQTAGGDPLARGEDTPGSGARSSGEAATWRIRIGPSQRADRPALVVFTPILPASGNASAVTQELCAGIPAGTRAVSAPQRESSLDVLRPAFPALREVATLCQLSRGRSSQDGQEFRLRTPAAEYRLTLPVLGQFQIENAATALLAVEQLVDEGVPLTPEIARAALSDIRLPGRFELIKRRPLIVVDAASHPVVLRRVADGLRELAGGRRMRIVLDVPAGLDPAAALPALAPLRPDLFAVLARERADERAAWNEACYEAGVELQIASDLTHAVDAALSLSEPGDAIAITGSRPAAAIARALVLGLAPPAAGPGYTGG